MTMTMQSKDRPAVPFRACAQPCHALKSLIWKSPIRPWSGHGDGGSDCRPFCKLGLGQANTGPFQPASVGPLRETHRTWRSGSNRFHGRVVQDLFVRNLGREPHSPITQRRGRRLVALDRQRWTVAPWSRTWAPPAFPSGLSLRSSPRQPTTATSGTREATATHEPQTPPSLSLRLRTPLVVIHKCILPPSPNTSFPSASLH